MRKEMTKEEIIQRLKNCPAIYHMSEANQEAIEGAIELLSSTHSENSRNEKIRNLYEAAEEWAEKHSFRVPYDGSNKFYDEVDAKASLEGFKAGAEWMAGQGVKATATVGYYNQSGLSILTEPSIKKLGFKEGDELEITIRKK